MLPLGRIGRRRLVAAAMASAMVLIPLTTAASDDTAAADALWNQSESVSADSAFYVVQSWWDGMARATQSDSTQRGLDELAQANADLPNAHALLTTNAQRETAFLLKIKAVSNPGNGLAGLLRDIDQSTTALAARHHGNGNANANANANANGKHSQPKPKTKGGPGG